MYRVAHGSGSGRGFKHAICARIGGTADSEAWNLAQMMLRNTPSVPGCGGKAGPRYHAWKTLAQMPREEQLVARWNQFL